MKLLKIFLLAVFVMAMPALAIAAGNSCGEDGGTTHSVAPPWDPTDCNAPFQCGYASAKPNCAGNSAPFTLHYTWGNCAGGSCSKMDCFCLKCDPGYVSDGVGGCKVQQTCTVKTTCTGCTCTTTNSDCSTSNSCKAGCCGTTSYPNCGSECTGGKTCCSGSCVSNCGANCKLSGCSCVNDPPSGGSDGTGSFSYQCSGSCGSPY